jgi:hypothetical protein
MSAGGAGGWSEVFAEHDVNGSADGMADAIAGYGGAARSDDDASNSSTGQGTSTSSIGYTGSGGAVTSTGGMGGNATSGDGGAGGNLGSWGSSNGDDGFVSGESFADASATLDIAAFNQNIVMGANILGNSVDMTVVGGNLTSSLVGDDDLG